jgi:hypothetical protein
MPAALAPAPPSPVDRAADLPAVPPPHRSVAAHVTGGLDGALRVITLLRGRQYRVRDLHVDVRDGASRVTCTVVLTATDLDLLVARLQRLPAVVSAGPV